MTTKLPPSVFADKPAAGLSARYVHINTQEVVRALGEEGWSVAGVLSQAPRRRDPLFAKHVLDLRHPDLPALSDGVPRILVGNSHDGSMRASVMAGIFRFVCSNGMVVGSTYARERVVHAGESAKTLIDRVRNMSKGLTPMFQQVESWQRKDLTAATQLEYARLVATLRWGDPHRFPLEELLAARRPQDEGSDLWRTFNRVQEATTNLSLGGLSRNGRATMSRPLTEVTNNIRFNERLWQLTEEFAGL
jgi:hypothetical protein